MLSSLEISMLSTTCILYFTASYNITRLHTYFLLSLRWIVRLEIQFDGKIKLDKQYYGFFFRDYFAISNAWFTSNFGNVHTGLIDRPRRLNHSHHDTARLGCPPSACMKARFNWITYHEQSEHAARTAFVRRDDTRDASRRRWFAWQGIATWDVVLQWWNTCTFKWNSKNEWVRNNI